MRFWWRLATYTTEQNIIIASLETPEQRANVENTIPMGRLTNLRDLGLLAVYLASPASNWMTGQVIYLDGGQTASFL